MFIVYQANTQKKHKGGMTNGTGVAVVLYRLYINPSNNFVMYLWKTIYLGENDVFHRCPKKQRKNVN
jgi:hypothetical protein